MRSDNPRGADNQQESLSSTERRFWFLAGFVEGEGSVHISIKTHSRRPFGYYIQREFFIYQHRSRRQLLELAQNYFDAGRIRPKPGNPDVLVFSVISRKGIVARVAPFLARCMAMSARCDDYARFLRIVDLLEAGEHASPEGLADIVRLAYAMNMGGKQRRVPQQVILDRILRGHTPDALETGE
jgi:LAGLIDADG endonuclease